VKSHLSRNPEDCKPVFGKQITVEGQQHISANISNTTVEALVKPSCPRYGKSGFDSIGADDLAKLYCPGTFNVLPTIKGHSTGVETLIRQNSKSKAP
jgi:hypothetical protein